MFLKAYRGKIIFVFLTLLLAGYFLYPTFESNQFEKELKSLSGKDSSDYLDANEKAIRSAKSKKLKLGLDLQGGMRVVLEVDILKMLSELAQNKDDQFKLLYADIQKEASLSDESVLSIFKKQFENKKVRLSRYYGNLRESDEQIIDKLNSESEKAIDRAMEIVRNRVDQYGVSEPSIQKMGSRRIIVELPGVTKEDEVRQLLQGTAMLEFKLMKEPDIIYPTMEAIDKYLAGTSLNDSLKNISENKSAKKEVAKTFTPTSALEQVSPTQNIEGAENDLKLAKEHPFLFYARPNPQGTGDAYVSENDKERVSKILKREDVARLIPSDMEFYFSAKHAFIDNGLKYFSLYGLKKKAELTGSVIIDARATIDQDFNQPVVTMEMDGTGSREWARITGANVNKRMAIVLDDAVFSAPVIRGKITGGRSQIEGMENIDEARLLEIILKSGALPAPVEIMEQRSVGPSLGEDSILAGTNSTLIALLMIVLFMIIYYRTGGIVANVALVINTIFIFAVLAAFHGTLTLPGIAGIVLSIGMAVDANVLIYERIREELQSNKTVRAAIDEGYKKAFSAIFDSNITTLSSGIVLYQFGSGPIQGFALTLMMGVTANLFTAIVVTRLIFDLMTARGAKSINFG